VSAIRYTKDTFKHQIMNIFLVNSAMALKADNGATFYAWLRTAQSKNPHLATMPLCELYRKIAYASMTQTKGYSKIPA
jgi:hypothetical protein